MFLVLLLSCNVWVRSNLLTFPDMWPSLGAEMLNPAKLHVVAIYLISEEGKNSVCMRHPSSWLVDQDLYPRLVTVYSLTIHNPSVLFERISETKPNIYSVSSLGAHSVGLTTAMKLLVRVHCPRWRQYLGPASGFRGPEAMH